jgi:small GTP-binding protein
VITRKVCLLGAFAVGKTSLMRRFVEGVFDDRYLTTLGVKIDTKTVQAPTTPVKMIVWDIEGVGPADRNGELVSARMRAYVQGADGLLLVADGTRPHTLDVAQQLRRWVEQERPEIPTAFLLNKHDLASDWKVSDTELSSLANLSQTFTTSALSGENVERSFEFLAELMSQE